MNSAAFDVEEAGPSNLAETTQTVENLTLSMAGHNWILVQSSDTEKSDLPSLCEASDSEGELDRTETFENVVVSDSLSESGHTSIGLSIVSDDWINLPAGNENDLYPTFNSDMSEYITDYAPSAQEAIENFAPRFDPETEFATDSYGRLRLSWADEAKLVFGYPDSSWSDFFLKGEVDPNWHPAEIGDLVAQAAEFILNHHSPYPGDESRWGASTSNRISVFKYDHEYYTIHDFESEQGPVWVQTSLLLNGKFQLAAWYAKKCARQLVLPYNKNKWRQTSVMGNVYCNGLKFILTTGIRAYPKPRVNSDIDPFYRFDVLPCDDIPWQFFVWDNIENCSCLITLERLMNFHFDAVNWWRKTVLKSRTSYHQNMRRKLAEKRDLRLQRVIMQHERTIDWQAKRQGNILARALEDRLQMSPPFFVNGKPSFLSRFTAFTLPENDARVGFIDHERELIHSFRTSDLMTPDFAPGLIWTMFLSDDIECTEIEGVNFPVMGDFLAEMAKETLTTWVPLDSEVNLPRDIWYNVYQNPRDNFEYIIEDVYREFEVAISRHNLLNPYFNLPDWYRKRFQTARKQLLQKLSGPVEFEFLGRLFSYPETDFEKEVDRWSEYSDGYLHLLFDNLQWEERNGYAHVVSIAGVYIEPKTYPGLQRTASVVKDIGHVVPMPLVVVVHIDGKSV
ncbi:hypothetical protein VKT23_008249 [Stygiomarasmius scandens]|uniref:Uncharacterized protein n=1 Tax=Marasmiellus scandens TaxID=2682957 RepID=A0ABR1JKG4_9AGAR